MSRAFRTFPPFFAALTALVIVVFSGCGGGSDPEPLPEAGTNAGVGEATVSQGDGYGSEGSTDAGGAYGGGAYGGGATAAAGAGDGYAGDGYAGGMQAGYAGGMNYGGEGAGDGFDASMAAMGGGYAGGMMGYGGGMANNGAEGAGYGGGQNDPQTAMMMQFVQQNCMSCHGPQQPKGGVRLDGLTGNFADMNNSTAWSAVLEQVESDQMPPPRTQRRPDPTRKAAFVSWIKSSLSDPNFVPLEEQDYFSQAKYAFGKGKEGQAIDLLYAHALALDVEEGNQFLSQSRWSPLGLKPTLTMRFAVGVVLDAPESLTDLKPIGVSQANGGGGGNSYGSEGFGGGQGNGNAKSERTFQQLTGAFGESLATGFESRWATGNLGAALKDVEIEVPPPPRNGMGGFGGYGGGGYAGGVSYGAEGGGDGMGGGAGGGNAATAARRPVSPGSNIAPGLSFIGTGSQVELLNKAKELGVDGVFIFDVKASQNRRTGLVNNDTRLRFMTLDGKTLAATSTLVNVDIERAKIRGLDDDSLEKGMDRFFTMFDEKVQLVALPELKPEQAQSRMRQLLVDKQKSSLEKMFEARLYNSLGLLSEEELAKIYQIILRGNEGVALASGTVDDRKLVLSEVLTN